MNGCGRWNVARIRFDGLKEYELKLSKLAGNTREIAENAIYEGAKIVADEVKTNLNALNATTQKLAIRAYTNKVPTYITEEAKQGLIDSFGVTKVREENGYYDVKLGFDGYNKVVTKKYPKGQPNNMIARACESGSTSMIKQPFMREAVSSSKGRAEAKMAEILDKEIKKQMED